MKNLLLIYGSTPEGSHVVKLKRGVRTTHGMSTANSVHCNLQGPDDKANTQHIKLQSESVLVASHSAPHDPFGSKMGVSLCATERNAMKWSRPASLLNSHLDFINRSPLLQRQIMPGAACKTETVAMDYSKSPSRLLYNCMCKDTNLVSTEKEAQVCIELTWNRHASSWWTHTACLLYLMKVPFGALQRTSF